MKVEVLMSVMHQNNFDIAYKSKIDSDLLVINQCDIEGYEEIVVNGHRWRMISTTERGLSKSRNMALTHAIGDLCIISDDDEIFADGYEEIVKGAFQHLSNASVIAFNVHRINVSMKKKYYQIKKIIESPSFRSYGSVMLAFRLGDIRNSKIQFNERFGSGSDWGGGEDTLFIKDIRKHKLKIYEYPQYLSTIDYSGLSQWFNGYDEKYFYNLGAFLDYADKNIIKALIYSVYTTFWKLRKERLLSPFCKLLWIYRGFKGNQLNVTYNKFLERYR